MSTIDKGAAVGPPPEPGVFTYGGPPAGQARFDAFVSYRRIADDMAFVDDLQEALVSRGKHVWVDRAKIEPAADWSQRITRGIEAAKAFIFVITPESVISEECLHELEMAADQHKLVIPVVLRDVAARRGLPESLSRPNWIFFSRGREDARALDEVVQALEEDLDWRDAHTRLAVRTKEWLGAQRDRSFLLRGSDLRAAEKWMAQAPLHSKTPPTMQQTEYILASRKASMRTQRTWQGALSVGLVVALALAAFAFLQRQQAIHQRDVADSGLLVNKSEVLGDTDPSISKLEAIAAWRIEPSPNARYAMLAAAARPGIAVLAGHLGWVDSVAFSPDGKILASGGEDGTVRLWDAATHKQIGRPLVRAKGVVRPPGTFGPNELAIDSVAFSPDGKMLATSGGDGTTRLWDLATRQQIGRPLAGGSVAFSPDGKMLATTADDGTVRLWDLATHQQIGRPLTGHNGSVFSVAFSHDGKMLASGGFDDGTVRLWDVATHQQISRPLPTPSSDVRVWSVAFSPDGKMLASSGGDVRLWDVATRQQIGSPLNPHTDTLANSVAFSPDGTTLAAGYLDNVVRLWDVATGRQIGSPLGGHTGEVNSVAFSPDGAMLASGSSDDTVRLWDAAANRQIGRPLLTGTSTQSSAAVSPDGKTVARGNDDIIRLWDVATHQQIGSPLTGGTDYVESMAFSPNGRMLATGGDAMVQLWNVATCQQIGSPLTVPYGAISSVAFSPNGKVLASSGQDGTVRLWDVATGQQIGRPLPTSGALYSVAFSPNGTMVASGDSIGTVRLWDVATHKQIGSALTGGFDIVNSMAFSPDGTILATTVLGDATVRLWDVATHRQIARLVGPGPAYPVAFSPDGTILASGDGSGIVRLWDRATGQQFGGLVAGSASPIDSVAFNRNGKMLVSGSEDGAVRLWDMAYLPDVLHYLCASVGRSLTPAEWTSYIPPGPGYQVLCP